MPVERRLPSWEFENCSARLLRPERRSPESMEKRQPRHDVSPRIFASEVSARSSEHHPSRQLLTTAASHQRSHSAKAQRQPQRSLRRSSRRSEKQEFRVGSEIEALPLPRPPPPSPKRAAQNSVRGPRQSLVQRAPRNPAQSHPSEFDASHSPRSSAVFRARGGLEVREPSLPSRGLRWHSRRTGQYARRPKLGHPAKDHLRGNRASDSSPAYIEAPQAVASANLHSCSSR